MVADTNGALLLEGVRDPVGAEGTKHLLERHMRGGDVCLREFPAPAILDLYD